MNSRRILRWFILLPTLFAALLLVALIRPASAQSEPAPPYDPAAVPTPATLPSAFLGQSIFQQNCAPCHGLDGNSDGPSVAGLPAPPPKFADAATVANREPGEWFHIAKYGKIETLMPPWGNVLSDDEIWQALFFGWSLHTSQVAVDAGQTLFAAECAACHGAAGAGDGPEAPAGLPSLADPALMNLRSPAELMSGWTAAHPAAGAGWSEMQKAQTLDFIRTFTYVPPWQSPFVAGEGVITGTVVAGTLGAAQPAGLAVNLTAYMDFTPVATFSTTIDGGGAFRFTGLSTDPGVVYLADVVYNEVGYGSDLLALTPVTPTLSLELPVFETTADGSQLRISRANWVIDHQPGASLIGQILVVGNAADRTFTGSAVDGLDVPVTVVMPVPEGATQIEFQDGAIGGRYQLLNGRVYDTTPIRPGRDSRQIFISYLMPHSGKTTTIDGQFAYPIENLNVLVTELPGLTGAVSGDLTAMGAQSVQGVSYQVWSGQQIPANESIAVSLEGVLAPGDPDPRSAGEVPSTAGSAADTAATTAVGPVVTTPPMAPQVAIGVGAVLALLLTGVLAWSWIRQHQADPRAVKTAQREQLLGAVVALDEQYEAGQLGAQRWSEQRAILKYQLLELAVELEQLPGAKTGGRSA